MFINGNLTNNGLFNVNKHYKIPFLAAGEGRQDINGLKI